MKCSILIQTPNYYHPVENCYLFFFLFFNQSDINNIPHILNMEMIERYRTLIFRLYIVYQNL